MYMPPVIGDIGIRVTRSLILNLSQLGSTCLAEENKICLTANRDGVRRCVASNIRGSASMVIVVWIPPVRVEVENAAIRKRLIVCPNLLGL